MILRTLFREKYSQSPVYPLLRKVYRSVAYPLKSLIRTFIRILLNLVGVSVSFDLYPVIQLPMTRKWFLLRTLHGPTFITKSHYFSFRKVLLYWQKDPRVQVHLMNIFNSGGGSVLPISIFQTSISNDGKYELVKISRFSKIKTTHLLSGAVLPKVWVPKESSFFHFYIQVVPYLLRTQSIYANFLDLDSNTSNFEVLDSLLLKLERNSESNCIVKPKFQAKQRGPYPSRSEVLLLRDHLERIGYVRKPQRNLYLTRFGNINGRQVENESDLIELLSKYDFEVIDPGTLPFIDQLEIFSKANIVVAPHGAALSHLVNFPVSSFIIELNNNMDVRWHIRKMSLDLGIKHLLLLGEPKNAGNFTVNVDQIESSLIDHFKSLIS